MKILAQGYRLKEGDHVRVTIELDQRALLDLAVGALEVLRKAHVEGFNIKAGGAALQIHAEDGPETGLSGKGEISFVAKKLSGDGGPQGGL